LGYEPVKSFAAIEDGAGMRVERVPFSGFDFQKRSATPTSKKPVKPAVVVSLW
jgi:hypothetical protein